MAYTDFLIDPSTGAQHRAHVRLAERESQDRDTLRQACEKLCRCSLTGMNPCGVCNNSFCTEPKITSGGLAELVFERAGHHHKEALLSVQDAAHFSGAIPHERHQASANQGKGNDHLFSK